MNESWQHFIDSLALGNMASPLQANAIYPQTTQGFIEISGIDAAKFLQGQLSCDIQQLTLEQSGLGSHSNAKGRMQSSFRICRYENNSFLLRIHHSILEQARTALAKYIVFSKATIAINTNRAGIGLHGDKVPGLLKQFFSIIPNSDYQQHIENDSILICTSATRHSYEIYTTTEKAIALWQNLSKELLPCTASQHQLLENHLGLAFVEAGTFDAFIPQMFNYQATPAISFRKGCYTGQEIVARMHYLGKMKRHMRHYTAEHAKNIAAGDDVFSGNSEQSIGDIVSCVSTGKKQWDLLINLTDEAAKNGVLNLATGSLEKVQELELPYTLAE